MLDRMREGSQGIAAKIVLTVIILSFALAGVSGYLGGGSASVAVMVNDKEISKASVEQAYKNERARLQQQYGEQFDILASNPNFAKQVRAQATQTLISDSLIAQAISEMGLRIGDEQVKNEIRKMPEFQVEGKFNNEQYLSLLRRASYSPAQFSTALKHDLARRQLLQMLLGSEFVLPEEVASANQLQAQKRIAKVLKVSAANFESAIQVNADEIKAYYDKNEKLFQYPEQVSVDYVLLDGEALKSQIRLSDAEIESYYESHKSDYQRAESRKVAHILVQGETDVSKNKAAAILSELEDGADFAQLAKEKSEDVFSAKNSGELDWFERGVMEPEFDQAAFALNKEAPLSSLVKSQFGYHIIKLVDVKESQTLPLAQVQQQVENALQKEKTNELYDELQQNLSEVAFESPDNLEEAAGVLDSDVQHTLLFSAQDAPEILANKAVLRTLFDADFREEGMNSEVIELADNKAIVVRINEYKMASTQPLSEVSESIVTQLKVELAREEAKAFIESLATKLNENQSIEQELADKNINFSDEITFDRYSRNFDYQVVSKVFKLAKPAEQQVTRDWVATSTGDYALIELSQVVEVDSTLVDNAISGQIATMLTRSNSEATYQALIAQLMENAEIKYLANN